MPWLETVPMEEPVCFVQDAFRDRFTMSERWARYGVRRMTSGRRTSRESSASGTASTASRSPPPTSTRASS